MLDYASGITADVSKRGRRYTVFAAILGALYTWSAVFTLFLLPKIPNQTNSGKWLFRGVGLFELALALAFFAIIALRHWKPRHHPLILAILNGTIMVAVPFGTALGLYYFLRLRPYDTQSCTPSPTPSSAPTPEKP